MTTDIIVQERKSLARYAADLEAICLEIDEETGEISEELIKRFDDARLDLATKCDNWIGYLDALKALVAEAKERKERAAKAQKTFEGVNKRLRDYLKFVMETNHGLAFKGTQGKLALQSNAAALKVDFELADKTIYKAIDPTLLELEPSLNHYVKQISCYVLDTERLKEDLKSGATVPWARLGKGSHGRTDAG